MPLPLTLKRIPPDMVVSAFREIGKKPIRGEYMNKERTGCCGITAVAISKLKPRGYVLDRYNVGLVAKQNLRLDGSYFAGWVTGFDNPLAYPSENSEREYIAGISDGKTAWQACVDANMVRE